MTNTFIKVKFLEDTGSYEKGEVITANKALLDTYKGSVKVIGKEKVEAPEKKEKELSKMNKNELLEKASELSVEGISDENTKKEILEAIQSKNAETES